MTPKTHRPGPHQQNLCRLQTRRRNRLLQNRQLRYGRLLQNRLLKCCQLLQNRLQKRLLTYGPQQPLKK